MISSQHSTTVVAGIGLDDTRVHDHLMSSALVDALRERADEAPTSEAVVAGDGTCAVTYAELDIRSDVYALELIEDGFEVGDVIVLTPRDVVGATIGLYATRKVGLVPIVTIERSGTAGPADRSVGTVRNSVCATRHRTVRTGRSD